jgi:hypothetical protein
MQHKRLLVAMVGVCWMTAGNACAVDVNVENEARQLVTKALAAEAAGDVSKHAALLGDAVAADPSFQLARWCRGELRVGDEWKPIADVQVAAAANPARGEYLQRREVAARSLDRQIELARWCRKHGLDDEARFHWATVLTHDPNNNDALRALGVRWHNGRLMTPEAVAAAKDQLRAFQDSAEEFRPQVARWERMLSAGDLKSRKEALAEIRALREPHAIAALEEHTLGTPLASNAQFERCLEVSQVFVAALDETPGQAATGSLLRHAVLSPLKSVREASIAALKKRPPHDYVPQLLGALAVPIESSYRVVTDGDGSVHYWHSLYREGPDANWSFEGRQSAVQVDLKGDRFAQIVDRNDEIWDLPAGNDPALQAEMANVATRNQLRFGVTAIAVEQQLAQTNRAIALGNSMIVAALAATTGQEFGDSPRSWWDWWTEYNEYYSDGVTPEYEQRYAESDRRYYRTPGYAGRYNSDGSRALSCFGAGTLVWTKTGPREIEKIEIGDMVLAQNVDTGQLEFKPVMGRTVRPPSKTLKVSCGADALETTLGHPFWVAGAGWRMAKELGEGAILHGVNGPVRIDAIEPLEEAEAYNLVVADSNTYFVGKSGILVHDNTPRRPTTAVVPGLSLSAPMP